MDQQTFWDLVGAVGRDPAADAYDRLTDALSDHSADDIRDFADHLARALYDLDTPAHYRAAAGEEFLGVRCAVVAAGEQAYRRVLASPPALTRFAHRTPAGCALLPVAERAYRIATRRPWDHRTPVCPETGSNADAWAVSWLHPLMGTTRDGQAPQAYMTALLHVVVALDVDPAWQAWWRRSGVATCELGIVAEGRLDHLRPSADIRKIDDKVRANFTCALPASAGSRPEDLLVLAVGEVTGMFEVIREAIGLPGLPPLPPLPELPADVRKVEVTTRALPSVPRELEQQGYLTLAQIQEFFG
ncbi:DUF4240 domain-containing protein [Jidongwangia harbinensis]|uniref:DUF4240 domain-containing protein n=1 Tax=Jidongwangia harbinensis TaxID=2878561 RepID=UPI001CD98DE0|nr:DUF4240 domain-containing protein [Jidongwangia harbinensis]MCA2214414.1 DUF4240 domain-containing protein [Jidongwangia harbinensis]